MKITAKGEYGVRVMTELARHFGEEPLPLSEVARRQAISLAYSEQIIASLKKAGLVKSRRGAKGGYSLALPPREITLHQVVQALDVPIAPRECVTESADSQCCDRQGVCYAREVWKRVRDETIEILDSTTLADLTPEKGASHGG